MKIICLGDSNTYGYDPRGYFGGRYDHPWPELLAAETGWNASSKVSNIMTISQGICWDMPVHGNRMWDYLHSADDMLYRVKQKKRNNFCIGNLTEAADQIIMSYL